MGRARNELRPGLRSHPHKSYVIFQWRLLDLMSKLEWDASWDYKSWEGGV